MFKVVLDTNVLVSAVLTSTGPNARFFDLVVNKVVELQVTQPILKEYEEVLSRPKFQLTESNVKTIMGLIAQSSTLVKPTQKVTASPDDADNRFLECAQTSKADYLVTGNKRHFPKRWKTTNIVNAKELLEIITISLQV